jgi:hypothetical protein
METAFTAVAALLGGVAAAIAASYSAVELARRQRLTRGTTDDREQRVARLSETLHEAVGLLSEFEDELRAGHARAQEMRAELETYEAARALKPAEVDAVATILRAELQQESRTSFRRDLLLSAANLIVGAGIAVVLTLWLA